MTVWRRLSDLAATVSKTGSAFAALLAGDAVATQALATQGTQPGSTVPVAFTMAVIALSAKMAKADGVVVGVEVDAFHRSFLVAEAERANVDRLFKLAQQDVAGYEAYALQIARLLNHDRRLLEDVLDSLFHIATADRALHPSEDAFLARVAELFQFSTTDFQHHRAQFVFDPANPYVVLDLHPSATDEDVKRRHRKLVRETHPDLLMGRGVPAEMIAIATRKLAAINDAYAAIVQERGL